MTTSVLHFIREENDFFFLDKQEENETLWINSDHKRHRDVMG